MFNVAADVDDLAVQTDVVRAVKTGLVDVDDNDRSKRDIYRTASRRWS